MSPKWVRPAFAALLAALVVLAVAAAGPVAAQTFVPAGRILSIGLGGGVTVPVGDVEHALDNGVNGHGFIRLNLKAFPIQPRLDFTFQQLDFKDVSFVTPDFPGGTYTGGEQEAFSTLLQGQFALISAGPIQPYLIGGAGMSNFKTSLDGATGTASAEQSATQFTVSAGAGVNLKLGPLAGYVEARINNIMNDGELIDFDSVSLVPVTFGLAF